MTFKPVRKLTVTRTLATGQAVTVGVLFTISPMPPVPFIKARLIMLWFCLMMGVVMMGGLMATYVIDPNQKINR